MQSCLFEPRTKATPITLRPYQGDAVAAVYHHLRTRDDNPCVVIPTGGGKTPIIATLCRDAVKQWQGRVLVVSHVKELIEQTADKLQRVCPEVPVGIYSAGLGRREKRQPVIVAGIQSIYQKACDLEPFDLVLIDEAHLIPQDGEGMYRQFLADSKQINPQMRIIGLTATPFRLKSGPICTDEGFLNSICYEIGVRQLIVDGYLSPLITKAGQAKAYFEKIGIRGGEFIAEQAESLMDEDKLVGEACGEIVEQTQKRKACLIFTCGVKHGTHVVKTLDSLGVKCGFVTGDTPGPERARTLDDFKEGRLKYLANVNVLTTGFDATHIDCVALLRPTMSPGLYYQMVGRGFRLHDGKANCLVLDYGGNVLRHGPVDQLTLSSSKIGGMSGETPAKECPQCHSLISCGYARCPDCGYEFPPPEKTKHEGKANDAAVLSGVVTVEKHAVTDVTYQVWTKRNAAPDAPKTMRVNYHVGNVLDYSEWVCFEHPVGEFAQKKAAAWWKARSQEPVPQTCEWAVELAENGALAPVSEITVRKVSGDPYERIIDYVIGEIPPSVTGRKDSKVWVPDDEIPF